MTCPSIKPVAFALLLGMATAAPASAAYIVDTGTPDAIAVLTFDASQYFAGEFSVGTNTTITGAEGLFWFDSEAQGSLTVSLHADNGHLPGAVLSSASFDIVPNDYDWYGFTSGLEWNVSAGTYWISFIPGDGLAGDMIGLAPNPLSEYAFGGDGEWLDLGPDAFDDIALAVRVSGHATAPDVPEPAAIGLIGLGVLGVSAVRRRRLS